MHNIISKIYFSTILVNINLPIIYIILHNLNIVYLFYYIRLFIYIFVYIKTIVFIIFQNGFFICFLIFENEF